MRNKIHFIITKNMKKLIISVIALCLILPNVGLAAFTDVNQNTTYQQSIDWMANNGVIQGYSDNTFKPDNCVTRVKFLKMLFITNQTDLTFEEGTAGSHYYDTQFSDIDLGSWYWQYVRTALKTHLIEGYSDGTFKPGQCVNRVEAIKIAVIEYATTNFVNNAWAGSSLLMSSYKDMNDQAWYYKYFTYVIFRNLVGQEHVNKITNISSDYGFDQYFKPGDTMARKEVAEMLYRMKTLKDNKIEKYSSNYSPIALP